MSEGSQPPTLPLSKRVGLLSALVFAIAALVAVVRFLPAPERTNFWDVLYDTGHIPVFGLVTVFLLFGSAILSGKRYLRRQYLVSSLVALAIGIAIEIWQQFLKDRSAEVLDVVNDVIGIVGCAMLFAIFDYRIQSPRRGLMKPVCLWLGAIVLFVFGCVPLYRITLLYVERRAALPTLLAFRDSWNRKFFYLAGSDLEITAPPGEWPQSRATDEVGKLTLKPGSYSGIVGHEPFPDWTSYQTLELDVLYQDDVERQFVVRVHDREHNNDVKDRFRKSMLMQPGFQTIRIPLADVENGSPLRKIDLKHISGFSLYTPGLKQSKTLYLGNVRLAK